MTIPDLDIQKIITDANAMQLLVEKAKSLAGELRSGNLTTAQIRAIFGEVRRVQSEWSVPSTRASAYRQLILLKPKMSYRARKDKSIKMLAEVLEKSIGYIEKAEEQKRDEYFKHFVEFFEAILAYYKA